MTEHQRYHRAVTRAQYHIIETLCNEGAQRFGADQYVYHLSFEYPNYDTLFLIAKATPQAMFRRYLQWWKPHRKTFEAQNLTLWHLLTEAGHKGPHIDHLLEPL